MTKIDIVSGFLGAGKTTLIKKLLAEAYPGEKLVLIENEFGEISIDGGFLKEAGIQISEMSSGCICCSLVGDFNKALKDVQAQFHPDRILIEPSGVGKLSDVIVAVENTVADVPDMKLTSYVSRHTMAMTLQDNQVPREVISQILGHSDLATTNTYLDSFASSVIDEAVKVL